jgi:hypothetical protein
VCRCCLLGGFQYGGLDFRYRPKSGASLSRNAMLAIGLTYGRLGGGLRPRIIDLLCSRNCIASRVRTLNVDPTLYPDVMCPDRRSFRRNALVEIVGDDPRGRSPHQDDL